jgi:predicted  nucleic acid-binding Zn-ribbon protein
MERGEELCEEILRINAECVDWEKELIQREAEMDAIDQQLTQKEAVLQAVGHNIEVIDDRLQKFDELISKYEIKMGARPKQDTKGRMLHEIKRIYEELEEHDESLKALMKHPRTLKDMLYLMSDVVARFREVETKARNHGLCAQDYSDLEEEFEQEGDF